MADIPTKMKDIRGLSPADLQAKVAELRRHAFDLRSQSVTENLKDTSELGRTRQAIARLLTVLSEKTAKPEAGAAKTEKTA